VVNGRLPGAVERKAQVIDIETQMRPLLRRRQLGQSGQQHHRTCMGLSVEMQDQRPLEHRSWFGHPGEQGGTRMQLLGIHRPQDVRHRPLSGVTIDGGQSVAKPGPQKRVRQIGARLVKPGNRIAHRQGTGPQTSQLGQHIPAPVCALAARTQLSQRRLEMGRLGLYEALQVKPVCIIRCRRRPGSGG
jgi:hypothetical protein